jgi:hypothetical protein
MCETYDCRYFLKEKILRSAQNDKRKVRRKPAKRRLRPASPSPPSANQRSAVCPRAPSSPPQTSEAPFASASSVSSAANQRSAVCARVLRPLVRKPAKRRLPPRVPRPPRPQNANQQRVCVLKRRSKGAELKNGRASVRMGGRFEAERISLRRGAADRTRTGTKFLSADFKSALSTIPTRRHILKRNYFIIVSRPRQGETGQFGPVRTPGKAPRGRKRKFKIDYLTVPAKMGIL